MSSTKDASFWVYKYLKAHPGKLWFVVITAVVEPFLYMLPLFITANIIGILADGGGWSEVRPIFWLLIPIAILQVLIFFVSSLLNEILAHRTTTDITYDLFETLQNRSLTYHDGKNVGDIMARATNDTRALNMALSPGLRLILANGVMWMVGFIIMFSVSFLVGIIGIVVYVIFVKLLFVYGRQVKPLSIKVLEELSQISEVTTDTIHGIRDVKAYSSETIFDKKFVKRSVKHTLAKEREGRVGAWFYPDLIVRIFLVGVVGYALFLTFSGSMSIRDLVLLTIAMQFIRGMSEEMNWITFIFVGGVAATNRLYQFMTEEDLETKSAGIIKLDEQPASVEFKDVTFGYSRKIGPVLTHINFKIEDSQTIAIVGSPGSGKSTLTKLIQRLYLPDSGKILIGGIPLEEFDNQSLRQQIATVEQEVYLFNDTLEENIKFGRPTATLEEVEQTAILAEAHEFIEEFEDKYQTLIGENGVRLSGGQAQRIAIARALLINPRILIIDDGASALDAGTEAKIQNAISEILKTRTTIITTHRLAIIAQADKVIILDKGRIVGFGTHETLIQSNTFYRQLFDKHFELPPLTTIAGVE
ncbi:MAG: ABC transporter ATP-binding protein [Candidatus Heimdallarchaeota archaeon]|nr:ABC transporter ATP-binding protein [Candidatus Heimdallarchaeota archaeon]